MKLFSRQLDKVAERERKAQERGATEKISPDSNRIKKAGVVPREKSLGYLRQDILPYWSSNNVIDPFTIAVYSHSEVMWICGACKNEFSLEVSVMTRKKIPRCRECRDFEATDENRLSLVCPNLVYEWHPTKNGNLRPEDISYGKQIDIWWKCLECEHSWKTRLIDRSIQGKGCPICSKFQSKGVKAIKKFLDENNFGFEVERSFPNCKHKQHLRFDFYLKEYNLLIEYNGKQHYEAIGYFGGEESFREVQIRDEIKRKYCLKNKIRLLEIPYWEERNINKILSEILTD